jgi:hypothetical protein
VKLREGKRDAARRHGRRAASRLRSAASLERGCTSLRLNPPPAALAAAAECTVASADAPAGGMIVFDVVLQMASDATAPPP